MIEQLLDFIYMLFVDWFINGTVIFPLEGSEYRGTFFVTDRVLLWLARNVSIVLIMFYVYFNLFAKYFPYLRIVKPALNNDQLKRETKFALLGALPSIIISTVPFILFPNHLKYYTDIHEHGLWYFWLSFPVIVIVQDFYSYFMHRLLHRPWFFEKIHYAHHMSKNTNPLTALSFHPIEATVYYVFPFMIILIVPVHIYPLTFLAWTSIILTATGHGGWEICPKFLRRRPWRYIINASQHHAFHHKKVNKNFSLYFNYLDYLFGTNHEEYEEELDKFNETSPY